MKILTFLDPHHLNTKFTNTDFIERLIVPGESFSFLRNTQLLVLVPRERAEKTVLGSSRRGVEVVIVQTKDSPVSLYYSK